jgi:hypothetical protein
LSSLKGKGQKADVLETVAQMKKYDGEGPFRGRLGKLGAVKVLEGHEDRPRSLCSFLRA